MKISLGFVGYQGTETTQEWWVNIPLGFTAGRYWLPLRRQYFNGVFWCYRLKTWDRKRPNGGVRQQRQFKVLPIWGDLL